MYYKFDLALTHRKGKQEEEEQACMVERRDRHNPCRVYQRRQGRPQNVIGDDPTVSGGDSCVVRDDPAGEARCCVRLVGQAEGEVGEGGLSGRVCWPDAVTPRLSVGRNHMGGDKQNNREEMKFDNT